MICCGWYSGLASSRSYFTHAHASIETPYGTLGAQWHRSAAGSVDLTVTVPANTKAAIAIPELAREVTVERSGFVDETETEIVVGSGRTIVRFQLHSDR